jgi:hypothetical protein
MNPLCLRAFVAIIFIRLRVRPRHHEKLPLKPVKKALEESV